MNDLRRATPSQLFEWLAAINQEIEARMMGRINPPAPPQPPWMTPEPSRSMRYVAEFDEPDDRMPPPHDSGYALKHKNEPLVPHVADEVAKLRAELAQAEARTLQRSTGAPAMLHRPVATGPGVFAPTAKSDPQLLAALQATPTRHEGVPPVNGNGRGDGSITF